MILKKHLFLRREFKNKIMKKVQDSNLLFQDFLKGNNDAFAKIYELYAKDLYAFGLSMHAKTTLIEDAIQDVFTDIYTRRKNLPEIHNLKLYIMGAFRNRLFVLSKKEDVFVEMTDSNTDTQMQDSDMETWIEKETTDEKILKVRQLMAKLNIRQREVLYYRFVDELSIEDIASLMNINYQSVKNLIHRTVKKLRTSEMKIMLFLSQFFFKKVSTE